MLAGIEKQTFDADLLTYEFRQLIGRSPVLSLLHQHYNLDAPLKILCYQALNYPTQTALLSRAYMQEPQVFEKAMFCSWIAVLLGSQLALDVVEKRNVFLAGLFQDIGLHSFTHLAPTLKAYRRYQDKSKVHPLLSGKMLEVIPQFPKKSITYICQHHERADGSGYPEGLSEANIELGSQILIVANQVVEWLERERIDNFDLPQLLPLIRHQLVVGFQPVYRALFNLLIQAQPLLDNEAELIRSEGISDLLDRQRHLNTMWNLSLKVLAELPRLESERSVIALRGYSQQAWRLVNASGVLSDTVTYWLRDLQVLLDQDGIPALISEYQEVRLLLGELTSVLELFRAELTRIVRDEPEVLNEQQFPVFSQSAEQLWSLEQPIIELDEYALFSL